MRSAPLAPGCPQVLKNTLAKASMELSQKKSSKANLLALLQDRSDSFGRLQAQAEKTTVRLEKAVPGGGPLAGGGLRPTQLYPWDIFYR